MTMPDTEDYIVFDRTGTPHADFRYIDHDGKTVVEDTKGVKTPVYILKRKLLLWVHGIRVVEV